MDPVITKLNTTLPDSPSRDTAEQPGKSGASKFDKVRHQLKDAAGSEVQTAGAQSPTQTPATSDTTSADRVRGGAPITSTEQVNKSLSASQYHLARLKERIDSTPGANSISGLQSRLSSIEHQYTKIDAAAKAMPANASPQQLIALQQQVYSMNESIGVLSKMVTQAASGVKSVLQTQV